MDKHLVSSPSTSLQLLKLHLDIDYVLPTDTGSLYRAVDSNTYGRRAFPVAGPTVLNSLPYELRDPACDIDSFIHFFKTILFSL